MIRFVSNRLRASGTAVWLWWLVIGMWGGAPVPTWGKVTALFLLLGLAWWASAGRPFWPSLRGERPVLLASLLLVLNAFGYRVFGLTPRLSFLTAAPLLLTLALAADRLRIREPFRSPLERLWQAIERHRIAFAALLVAAFNLWFSFGGWLRFRAMNVEFWDVGSISQAMSNLAHGFGYVKSVTDGTVSNRFAQHFEPLFYLLSPVMRLDRGVEIMLILQALSVSTAAVFIGLAMEKVVKHRAAFWIGLVGLCLHPAAGFPLWTDFHGDVFAVLPLSILLWALATGRSRLFWLAFIAAAACKEYSMIATSGIALAMLWEGRRNPPLRRQAILLLGCSVVLLLALELWLMPMFRPDDLPSVLDIHLRKFRLGSTECTPAVIQGGLGHTLHVIFNRFNLANLFQALLPFSVFLFSGPAALLGASLNITKDMIFGFDIGTHHFAPALPILFAGTAWAIRDSFREDRRSSALFQMGVCLAFAGFLWGPGYWGRIGWMRMAHWSEMAPATDKTHLLFSGADPTRPRMVTGAMGGILFRSPELYFLGTSGAKFKGGSPPQGLDVYVEMWDQPFPEWTPLADVQDDLARFLEGNKGGIWKAIVPGTLTWVEAGAESLRGGMVTARVLDPDLPESGNGNDAALQIRIKDWAALAGPSDSLAYALVAVGNRGECLPLGLRAPGRPWLMFVVGMDVDKSASLRLLSAPSSKEGTAAVKYWTVVAEGPLN